MSSSISGQNRRQSTTSTQQTESKSEAKDAKSSSRLRQLFSGVKNIDNTASGPTSATFKVAVFVAMGASAVKGAATQARDATRAVFKTFVSVGGRTQRSGEATATTATTPDMARKRANVDKIINALNKKITTGQEPIELLFRQSGNSATVREMTKSIGERDIGSAELDACDAHVLASVLKGEIRSIGLLSHDSLNRMNQPDANHARKVDIMKSKIALLSDDKKAIVSSFMSFIKSSMMSSDFPDGSQIDSSHMAEIIAPNLFDGSIPASALSELSGRFEPGKDINEAIKQLIDDAPILGPSYEDLIAGSPPPPPTYSPSEAGGIPADSPPSYEDVMAGEPSPPSYEEAMTGNPSPPSYEEAMTGNSSPLSYSEMASSPQPVDDLLGSITQEEAAGLKEPVMVPIPPQLPPRPAGWVSGIKNQEVASQPTTSPPPVAAPGTNYLARQTRERATQSSSSEPATTTSQVGTTQPEEGKENKTGR